MHLWFTDPHFDEAALDAAKDADRVYLDDPLSDPGFASYAALNEARYGADPRYRLLPSARSSSTASTTDDVERIFTRTLFTGGDWIFVFSGDFDIDDAHRRPCPPATSARSRAMAGAEQYLDVEPEPMPTGVVELEPCRPARAATGSLTLQFTVPASTDVSSTNTWILRRPVDQCARYPPHRPDP